MANGKVGRPKGAPREKRPVVGRPKGSVNRRTILANGTLAEHARTFTKEATSEIFRLMKHADSEQVRLAAAIHLLDRGYGKPFQSVQILEESDVKITYQTAEDLRKELMERGIPSSLLTPPVRTVSKDDALDAAYEDVTDKGQQ